MTLATQFESVPLERIVGPSPLNPRQDMESDVSMLAATIKACGLSQPPLVRAVPGDASGAYEILDGSRRWRALRLLQAAAPDAPIYVPVNIFDGDDDAAREAALANAVTQKPLHPVEEFEAFAQLAADGASVARIANDFGLTERHVRQRLALGNLSPRVRAKWRAGEIDRDEAQAFTLGSLEAQDALLDKMDRLPRYQFDVYYIRGALRGETLSNSGPDGKFLLADKTRVETYIAAGGRIDENLFEDEVIIRDRVIAKRIVSEALRAAAETVRAEEGWGAALIEGDCDSVFLDDPEPEFTPGEEARLEEIQAALRDADPASTTSLRAQEEAIRRDAICRMFPFSERTDYAVVAALSMGGEIYFNRGVAIPERQDEVRDDVEGAGGAEDGSQSDGGEEPVGERQVAPHDSNKEPSKALRAVIDAATRDALSDIVARRGDLALMIAVAAIGCGIGASPLVTVRGAVTIEDQSHSLLAEIEAMRFDEALAVCARAETNDLSTAFFKLVAASIDPLGAQMDAIAALCAALRWRGTDLSKAFDAALDRRAFFEAAPKADTRKIVAGLIGENEAKRVAKMDALARAEHVARLSKDKGHLPAPFADWAAAPAGPDAGADAIHVGGEMTLAQAMSAALAADRKESADAIAADDKEGEDWNARVDAVCEKHAAPLFARFLKERVLRGSAWETKVSDFRLAFDAFGAEQGNAVGAKKFPSAQFSGVLKELGIGLKRGRLMNISAKDATP